MANTHDVYNGPYVYHRTKTSSAGRGKTEHAYEVIKQQICEGVLPQLEDIVEEELQKELGISRTPIREAIQRLQKEGFVYIYPRKGMIVSEVTRDLVYEVYQVREMNEPYIVREASHSVPEEWLQQKRQELATPPNNLSGDKLRRYYINLDRELHSVLLRYCGNRFLQNIMSIVYDHNHRIRIKTSDPQNHVHDKSVAEHIAIIDAVLKRDEFRIAQATTEHIQNSMRLSLEYYRT